MVKKYKSILVIGSSSVELTGVVFENGNFGRCFYKKYRYDGIKSNFFINPEKLSGIISGLLNEYSNKINCDVNQSYVVLPQRFFRFKHSIRRMAIKNETVNKFDVADIINCSFVEIEDCERLECIPIAYRIKDDYIDNPIGQECENLEMISVSVGILTRIAEFFDDISKRINTAFFYVPTIHPLLNKLQNSIATNRSSRLIVYFNEDYIDVCYCEMRAVIAEKIIEAGNDDFIATLAEISNTDVNTAEKLLEHINFNISSGSYVVGGPENVKEFNVGEINTTIKKLYEVLAEKIKDAIETMVGDAILPIYIAGRPICAVRGADSLLTEKIGMPVSVLCADTLLWKTPSDYVTVGLIEDIKRV